MDHGWLLGGTRKENVSNHGEELDDAAAGLSVKDERKVKPIMALEQPARGVNESIVLRTTQLYRDEKRISSFRPGSC